MNQDLLAQLADIELPAAPDNHWDIFWLILILGIIISIGAYLIYKRDSQNNSSKSLRANALSKLDQLERQWRQGLLDSRQTAFQLAALLRLGLRLPQLTPTCPAHIQNPGQWPNTIRLLQQLRYSNNGQENLSQQTFTNVRQWLNHGGEI